MISSTTSAQASDDGGAPAPELKDNTGDVEMQSVPIRRSVRRPNLQYKGMNISVAAAQGNLPNVVLLFGLASTQGCNIIAADEEGNNPMQFAALAETPEVCQFLWEQTGGVLGPGLPLMKVRNADGETPLLRAATMGNLLTIKWLLAHGSDVMAEDTSNKNTVLHNTARNGRLWALHLFVETAAAQGLDNDTMKRFLNSPDVEEHTCLDWACFNGHLQVAEYLIQRRGMDPTRTDSKGRNCLHLAARQGHCHIVRYLVGKVHMSPHQQDLDGKDVYGYTNGDAQVMDALNCRQLTGEEAKLPIRLNHVRPGIMLSYALVTAFLWYLPFFLSWYLYIPLLGLLGGAYKRLVTLFNVMFESPKGRPNNLRLARLAQWFLAHENFLGLWLGTVLAFTLTYPVLITWGRYSLPSRGDEIAHHALTGTLPVGPPSNALVISMYATMAMTMVLWADLVFRRPDPGALKYDAEDAEKFLRLAAVSGQPPPVNQYCHTCSIRKPLRSKHCKACGFCIARMDHHCVWLDNCVGVDNHGRFLLFVALHVMSTALFLAMVSPFLHQAVQEELPHKYDMSTVIRVLCLRPIFPIFLHTAFAFACTFGLGFLLQGQISNVTRNLTSNEAMNGFRYPWIMGGNRFNRGAVGNWKEFLEVPAFRRDYRTVYDLNLLPAALPSKCCSKSQCSSGNKHLHVQQSEQHAVRPAEHAAASPQEDAGANLA